FFFSRWDAKNRNNDYRRLPNANEYPGANPDLNLAVNGKTVNQEMHEYLEALTGGNTGNKGNGDIPTEIPGFGGCFLNKYPKPAGLPISERSQILAEIMD